MPRRRLYRRSLKRARIRFARHAFLVGVLALSAIVTLNYAIRGQGGSLSLLSMTRLGDRAEALASLLLHGLRCSHADAETEALVRSTALRHEVSVNLALAMVRVESDFVHTRISGTGAMGLMQLMPDTARELGVLDPFDPAQNLDGGVRYIKGLLSRYRGDVPRAVAAYNAGLGRVPRTGPLTGLPYETRTYVSRVVGGL